MQVLIILVIAFIAVASAYRTRYYWRDYNGTIPCDALKLTDCRKNNPVYIGQAYFPAIPALLPGRLRPGSMELCAVADNRVNKIQTNVKILCTNSDNQQRDFKWIEGSNTWEFKILQKIKFLTIPIGGIEKNTDVYIGRHCKSELTNVGKIYTISPYCGMYSVNDNQKIVFVRKYETLVMLNNDCNCNKFWSICRNCYRGTQTLVRPRSQTAISPTRPFLNNSITKT